MVGREDVGRAFGDGWRGFGETLPTEKRGSGKSQPLSGDHGEIRVAQRLGSETWGPREVGVGEDVPRGRWTDVGREGCDRL